VHITAVRGALQQAAVPVLPQREDMARARLEGDLGDPAEIAGRADDDGGLGIADEVLDLGLLVGGIERQKDEPARSVARYSSRASTDFSTCTAMRLPSGSPSDSSRLAMQALARSRSRQE